MAAGVGFVVWHEVPYINWRTAVAPVEMVRPVLRHDVKGDGAYHAPRSGDRQHRGIDLAAPLGSPVRAIRSGHVVRVERHRGLGRFVELKHAGGLRSLYGHLSEAHVTAGERVVQGQPIGTVGKTGNARHPLIEPHVHLEVVRWGEWIDPTSLGLTVAAASDVGRQPDGRGGE
jgi:murein DD-endopeptidase MepM/ murein hydrolase activator NlpD